MGNFDHMFWTNNSIFDKYVEAFSGDRFAAVMYISKIARRRMIRVNNCIHESDALSWITTGVEPEIVKHWREFKKVDHVALYIEDRLCYIEDAAVRNAVRDSISESQSIYHLIYTYNNIQDENKKARVRILCNMIWDEVEKLKNDYR